jgi:hypothetical protein
MKEYGKYGKLKKKLYLCAKLEYAHQHETILQTFAVSTH